MRTAAITTTVLLSAALLAGCKGGETVPGPPSPSPSSTSVPSPSPTAPAPTDPATTGPTTPPEPGDDEVSITVQIPERTAPPAGD